jgi:hypothetical protein
MFVGHASSTPFSLSPVSPDYSICCLSNPLKLSHARRHSIRRLASEHFSSVEHSGERNKTSFVFLDRNAVMDQIALSRFVIATRAGTAIALENPRARNHEA